MAVPLANLEAYWKLDEASGTRFDLTAGGFDLVEVGGSIPSSIGNLVGNSVQFPNPRDGNKRLEHADNPIFNPGDTDFTFVTWAFIQDFSGASTVGVIQKGRLFSDKQYHLFFRHNNDTYSWNVTSPTAVTTTINAPVTILPNTYHMIACFHDSVNDLIGIQIDAGTIFTVAHTGGIAPSLSSISFHIGASDAFPFNQTVRGLGGRQDETGYWSRVLSSSELTSLFNGGAGSTFVPPVLVEQTINSDTTIDDGIEEADFSFGLEFTKPSIDDFEHNIIITQTVPVAPTLLTATDLLTGDKVRLVWSGGGPFYNVFFKKTADVTFIKANQTPLPGSDTQYDVGGLDRNVSYDFQVSSINGEGVETL